MREKKWYPVAYMFIVTAIISTFVIGFTQATNKRVKANEKLIFEQAVLTALGLYNSEKKLSGIELHNIFIKKLKEPDRQTAGAYTLVEDGTIRAYAVPLEGQGFWATIKAVIGIAADKKTVTGFAVYQQNETPGLGAEISKPEFRSQFVDKVLRQGVNFLTIARPGTLLDQSSVHAVTGATQTCTRLEKLINEGLRQWQQNLPKENQK